MLPYKRRDCQTWELSKKFFFPSFFWQGKQLNETREYGVAFVVRNTLLRSVVPPTVGSERIPSLQLHSSAGLVTLISAYAPTPSPTTEVKDKFCDDLETIKKISEENHCLFSETLTLELALIIFDPLV